MTKIVITGANGNLGKRFMAQLGEQNDVIGCDVDTLDITDFGAVKDFMAQHTPNTIINCAAWTDVDGCAQNPDKALLINGIGAQNVALVAASLDADVVQISSNEVFVGDQTQAYHEMSQTRAVNPYGESKLYAERAVKEATRRHYVVRTAWLFAHGGRNFIQAIYNTAQAGKALRVVTDEIAHPTYTDDLAEAVSKLISTKRYGTYHFVNEGHASRYAFARYVLDKTGMADKTVEPISLNEWQRPSRPPYYTALANHAGESIGITLRPWQEAVDAFLQKEGIYQD
jgi:dTDP-4-dehydrorhamnose reductase